MDEIPAEEAERHAPSPDYLESPDEVMGALDRGNNMDIEVVPNSDNGSKDTDDSDDDDDDEDIELISRNVDDSDDLINIYYDNDSGFYVLVSEVVENEESGERDMILAHTNQKVSIDDRDSYKSITKPEFEALESAGKLITRNPATDDTKFVCSQGIGTCTKFWDEGSHCGEGATIVGHVNGEIFEGRLVTPDVYMATNMDDIHNEGIACLLICKKDLIHELISRTLGDDGSKGLFYHNVEEMEVGFVTWENNRYFALPAWKALVASGQHHDYVDIRLGDAEDRHWLQAKYWENIEDVDVEDGVENIYEF